MICMHFPPVLSFPLSFLILRQKKWCSTTYLSIVLWWWVYSVPLLYSRSGSAGPYLFRDLGQACNILDCNLSMVPFHVGKVPPSDGVSELGSQPRE